MTGVSIIIPARNEEFLGRTIEDLLEHFEADSEIIVVLDGKWAAPGIPQHERVNIIYVPESVGQRAAGNLAVKLAKNKYIFKSDAHCAFDQGFDRKMIEAFQETGDNVVMVPVMHNLHVYDWKCYTCGHKEYQDRQNICPKDGSTMRKKMIWKPRRTHCTAYAFDTEPHFQYHGEYKDRQTGDIVETMSLQGSAFMCSKDKYWELEIGNEDFGSWGSQGIQVACSFWLSGGRVLVNTRTWYAHCFRTKPHFGFPYELSGRQVMKARKMAGEFFYENKFPKQILPSSWLLEKFKPITGGGSWKGWHHPDNQKALERINKSGEDFKNRQKS
jgi:glycosyltransferase involved in cell wall biosynthesis